MVNANIGNLKKIRSGNTEIIIYLFDLASFASKEKVLYSLKVFSCTSNVNTLSGKNDTWSIMIDAD